MASSAGDAAAADAVRHHHVELAGRLTAHVEALLAAATDPGGAGFSQARTAALAFLFGDLLPHAAAEERALYPAAAQSDRLRMVIDAMLDEHRVLEGLVEELRTAVDPVRAAATGYALRVLFDMHLAKENDLVLPVVAAGPGTSLAGVLDRMHELLGEAQHATKNQGAAPQPPGKGNCGCGGHDDVDVPVIQYRRPSIGRPVPPGGARCPGPQFRHAGPLPRGRR